MPPVETKVVVSSTVALLASSVLAGLNVVIADAALLGSMPIWLQTVLIALVPTLAVLIAGYAAPHSPRVWPMEEQWPDKRLDEPADDVGDHEAGPGRPPYRPAP